MLQIVLECLDLLLSVFDNKYENQENHEKHYKDEVDNICFVSDRSIHKMVFVRDIGGDNAVRNRSVEHY
jgi:hypothetical protein